jgi:aerotaxis receptor
MKTNLPVSNIEVPFPEGRYIVSRTDLKGAITYANDTFVDVSGFSREELIGNNHNIVRHPDMLPGAFAWLWDTLKEGRPWSGIVKNRCKNGDFYWVNALVVPVRKNNETIGYMSVRTRPTRQQIADAEGLYQKLKEGKAKIPKASAWMRLPLKTKINGMVIWLIAAQAMVFAIYQMQATTGTQAALANLALQFLGVTGIAAGAALLLMQNKMMSSIRQIVGRLDHIAQGDLTDEIPLDRVDELGKLNESLITMQTHLKAMMAEIAQAADAVGENAQALSSEMEETRSAAGTQSSAVTRIAAAVQQLVVSVNEVAESAQKSALCVGASHGLLGDASARMLESQDASQSVVSTVNGAGTTMAELFQSISQIDRVSHVIRSIAEQTNLLALNAAIEAARAGESGRGFAVVADEVRKLAENSSRQTIEITASVQEIQRITQIAVTTMESAGIHVASADSAMNFARKGLDAVSHHGVEVSSLCKLIADGTKQQSAAGNDIAWQVEGIVAGIDQTSGAIDEVTMQAAAMSKTADHMRQLISYFRFIR